MPVLFLNLVGGLEHVFSISYGMSSFPIDFHIFQDGENHQPGMFPYFSDDEVAVDAHGQMVRPPEDLVPWVIKPISPSWVVDIYIYIYLKSQKPQNFLVIIGKSRNDHFVG